MQPIEIIMKWLDDEIKLSKVSIPKAVCLSIIGIDDFPNARFVSFQELIEECFLISGPLVVNSESGPK